MMDRNRAIDESSLDLVRSLQNDGQVVSFCRMLDNWLREDTTRSQEESISFGEARARALLTSTDMLDETAINDFHRLTGTMTDRRIVLCDLIYQSGLGKNDQMRRLAATARTLEAVSDTGQVKGSVSWLALIVSCFAWKSGYPLDQLDPSSPPGEYTPAGQVLKRSASFVRGQLQRSATDRERLARELSRSPSSVPTLEELTPAAGEIAPLPPHYRPPVPERYPEVSSETLQVNPEDAESAETVTTGRPLVITDEDIEPARQSETEVVRMPPIRIDSDQVGDRSHTPPSPLPRSAVVIPTGQSSQSRSSLTESIRQMLGHEPLGSTKLQVLVQQYPDGPGLFGLQVRVNCKGVKSYVAGTTDRDGKFVCELPVRENSGLTYDVDVTWPRDQGGDVERKSITMNADRTHFKLPFYRQLERPPEE